MSLLETVASDKARLFRSGWSRYDLARPGSLRLVPQDARSAALAADLADMVRSKMFVGTPPTWDAVLERLARLEAAINSTGHGLSE